jgi:hypothetical protein
VAPESFRSARDDARRPSAIQLKMRAFRLAIPSMLPLCASAHPNPELCANVLPTPQRRGEQEGVAAMINSAILRRLLIAVALLSVTAGAAATMGGPADAAVFPSLHRGGK